MRAPHRQWTLELVHGLVPGLLFRWGERRGADFFAYNQHINFVSNSCGSGSCGEGYGDVHVESTYSTGRKVTQRYSDCSGYSLYGLGTCAC